MLKDVEAFIQDRIGAVRCMRCSNPDLEERGNALVCPICNTEHYANGFMKRYPIDELNVVKEVNWASYNDNKRKEYEFQQSSNSGSTGST